MGAGCSRSLDPIGRQPFNVPHSKQLNHLSRVWGWVWARRKARVSLLCCSICGLLLQGAFCQTRSAENVPPPRYTVSAAQLHVPAKAWSRLEAAHKEFSKGNLDKAEREVDRALQIDPACGPAFSIRAFIRLAEKNLSGAMADARRAILIDPYDADSLVALAMAYNSLKDFQSAAHAAAEALEIRPDSWQARLESAKSLYGLGQSVSALRELDAVNRDFPDVHLVRGNILMSLGRREEAVEEFRFFLREEPLDPRSGQIRGIVAQTLPPGVSESVSATR